MPKRSGGHPACRGAGASRPADQTGQIKLKRRKSSGALGGAEIYSGRQDAALYGRRDVCRYES